MFDRCGAPEAFKHGVGPVSCGDAGMAGSAAGSTRPRSPGQPSPAAARGSPVAAPRPRGAAPAVQRPWTRWSGRAAPASRPPGRRSDRAAAATRLTIIQQSQGRPSAQARGPHRLLAPHTGPGRDGPSRRGRTGGRRLAVGSLRRDRGPVRVTRGGRFDLNDRPRPARRPTGREPCRRRHDRSPRGWRRRLATRRSRPGRPRPPRARPRDARGRATRGTGRRRA
jgi:hypothetical protein